MEPDDVVEESLGDGFSRVRVCQWDEMAVLAEPIHHGEDHRLAADSWQRLYKVKRDISPHALRNRQRKEEARRVLVLGLVALTDFTCTHPVLHNLFHVSKMEIAAQPVEGPLYAFMAILMYGLMG
jgi:hypothetical protein